MTPREGNQSKPERRRDALSEAPQIITAGVVFVGLTAIVPMGAVCAEPPCLQKDAGGSGQAQLGANFDVGPIPTPAHLSIFTVTPAVASGGTIVR